jgi:hypothetical protein
VRSMLTRPSTRLVAHDSSVALETAKTLDSVYLNDALECLPKVEPRYATAAVETVGGGVEPTMATSTREEIRLGRWRSGS